MTRNPKQVGTQLFDCIPQAGKCPMACNECFFNRNGAFYTEVPSIPTPEEVGDGVVRVNSGNDSNHRRDLVIETAQQYKHAFFNTSLPKLDFPGPVVFTANGREELPALLVNPPGNLMFVRLRVSGTNLHHCDVAVKFYTERQVPVVLTFMSYYDSMPQVDASELGFQVTAKECYKWGIRHLNPYHCPTEDFIRAVMYRYWPNRLVSFCGSFREPFCRTCRNCEAYYLQTAKRLRGE